MNFTTYREGSTGVLDKVPTTVFLFLGVSRQDAYSVGMVGCGLQLDDTGDYAWGDTTITLLMGNPHVRVFLNSQNIAVSYIPGTDHYVRIPILDMGRYIELYPDILSFMEKYRRNRFLRLGHRALLDPWDLDSRDSYLLLMSDEEFSSSFIADPRGQPLLSEITSRTGRHTPKQIRDIPGLPAPGLGKWI